MLKSHVDAIKIIGDIYSNPYNNSKDRRIIKRGINQVEKDDSEMELGKQVKPMALKIKTLLRAQTQVLITTPSFPTCDKCGIVHGSRECIVYDKLVAAMDEINFVGE